MRDNLQETLWTHSADNRAIENGLNVCGGAANDPLIGKKIDVVVRHSPDTLVMVFGSTLKSDPCFASLGISNLEIYAL